MYNILQLREKDQDELRAIATNMGIKDAKSLNRDKLIYAILDEQAISASSSPANNSESKETKRDDDSRRRGRPKKDFPIQNPSNKPQLVATENPKKETDSQNQTKPVQNIQNNNDRKPTNPDNNKLNNPSLKSDNNRTQNRFDYRNQQNNNNNNQQANNQRPSQNQNQSVKPANDQSNPVQIQNKPIDIVEKPAVSEQSTQSNESNEAKRHRGRPRKAYNPKSNISNAILPEIDDDIRSTEFVQNEEVVDDQPIITAVSTKTETETNLNQQIEEQQDITTEENNTQTVEKQEEMGSPLPQLVEQVNPRQIVKKQ